MVEIETGRLEMGGREKTGRAGLRGLRMGIYMQNLKSRLEPHFNNRRLGCGIRKIGQGAESQDLAVRARTKELSIMTI